MFVDIFIVHHPKLEFLKELFLLSFFLDHLSNLGDLLLSVFVSRRSSVESFEHF